MRTRSLDLRERILTSYNHPAGTREEIAYRFRVSLGMGKKLLQQRRRTGDIRPRHRYSGRKPMIVEVHRRPLRALLSRKPDMTLKELRQAVALPCTLPASHYTLAKLGLTYKKRPSEPVSKTVRISPAPAVSGGGSKAGSTRRN